MAAINFCLPNAQAALRGLSQGSRQLQPVRPYLLDGTGGEGEGRGPAVAKCRHRRDSIRFRNVANMGRSVSSRAIGRSHPIPTVPARLFHFTGICRSSPLRTQTAARAQGPPQARSVSTPPSRSRRIDSREREGKSLPLLPSRPLSFPQSDSAFLWAATARAFSSSALSAAFMGAMSTVTLAILPVNL